MVSMYSTETGEVLVSEAAQTRFNYEAYYKLDRMAAWASTGDMHDELDKSLVGLNDVDLR